MCDNMCVFVCALKWRVTFGVIVVCFKRITRLNSVDLCTVCVTTKHNYGLNRLREILFPYSP
jgi:hypothetical protein